MEFSHSRLYGQQAFGLGRNASIKARFSDSLTTLYLGEATLIDEVMDVELEQNQEGFKWIDTEDTPKCNWDLHAIVQRLEDRARSLSLGFRGIRILAPTKARSALEALLLTLVAEQVPPGILT
jgi:hypothetical protein